MRVKIGTSWQEIPLNDGDIVQNVGGGNIFYVDDVNEPPAQEIDGFALKPLSFRKFVDNGYKVFMKSISGDAVINIGGAN